MCRIPGNEERLYTLSSGPQAWGKETDNSLPHWGFTFFAY